MHPIERLRYVARSSGAPAADLVGETARALAAFADDPAGMVTACRRIVERHPSSGPLWWLCSRVLMSGDPMGEAWRAAEEVEDDPTPRALARALPDDTVLAVAGSPDTLIEALPRRGDVHVLVVDAGHDGHHLVHHLQARDVAATLVPQGGAGAAASAADLVVLDAQAMGPDKALSAAGGHALAAVAHHAGVPVWLVAGRGRLLPRRVWDALDARLDLQAEPWDLPFERLPLALVDRVVGPTGPEPVADALRRTDCPVAPELLKTP